MAKKMFEGALACAIFLIGSVSYGEDRAAPATALEKEVARLLEVADSSDKRQAAERLSETLDSLRRESHRM